MSRKSKFIDYECGNCGGKYHSMAPMDYCPYCGKPYAKLSDISPKAGLTLVFGYITILILIIVAIIAAGYFLITWLFF